LLGHNFILLSLLYYFVDIVFGVWHFGFGLEVVFD